MNNENEPPVITDIEQAERQQQPTEQQLSEIGLFAKYRRAFSLLIIAALVIAMVLIAALYSDKIAAFLAGGQFHDWLDNNIWKARLVFVGIVFLQVLVAVIPGEFVEVAAGYSFGAWEGMLLCMTGMALASALILALVRRYGVYLAEAFVSRERLEAVTFINKRKYLNWTVFIIFLIPGTPKDIFTYFIGLTKMRIPVFLLISTAARIPSIITSTWGGSAVMLEDYRLALLIFAVTAVVSAIGIFIYRFIYKKNRLIKK
ncbi:MAG: VTT domain-containing protein [Bacillota bacterium]|nr:VTT domain-containing protein [Bacillota bacterium]